MFWLVDNSSFRGYSGPRKGSDVVNSELQRMILDRQYYPTNDIHSMPCCSIGLLFTSFAQVMSTSRINTFTTGTGTIFTTLLGPVLVGIQAMGLALGFLYNGW